MVSPYRFQQLTATKNCVDMTLEKVGVQFSIEHPHLGQQKIAMNLTEDLGVDASAGVGRSM